MTLDQIVKMQSIVDKRAIRSDTLEFLNEQRFSESKQCMIRYGDMHIDHFLRVYESLFIFKKPLENKEDKTKEMFESIKKRILQEFGHGNH
jgi:hypothetical protein